MIRGSIEHTFDRSKEVNCHANAPSASTRHDLKSTMATRASKGPAGRPTTNKSGRSVAREKKTDAKHSAPKGMKDRGD
jgi:hypothetical protein